MVIIVLVLHKSAMSMTWDKSHERAGRLQMSNKSQQAFKIAIGYFSKKQKELKFIFCLNFIGSYKVLMKCLLLLNNYSEYDNFDSTKLAFLKLSLGCCG